MNYTFKYLKAKAMFIHRQLFVHSIKFKILVL